MGYMTDAIASPIEWIFQQMQSYIFGSGTLLGIGILVFVMIGLFSMRLPKFLIAIVFITVSISLAWMGLLPMMLLVLVYIMIAVIWAIMFLIMYLGGI